MQPTIPSDDEAWIRERIDELNTLGVWIHLPGGSVHGWYCEALANGTVYCSEKGDSLREAVEKTYTKIIAARLEGMKFESARRGTFVDFPP